MALVTPYQGSDPFEFRPPSEALPSTLLAIREPIRPIARVALNTSVDRQSVLLAMNRALHDISGEPFNPLRRPQLRHSELYDRDGVLGRTSSGSESHAIILGTSDDGATAELLTQDQMYTGLVIAHTVLPVVVFAGEVRQEFATMHGLELTQALSQVLEPPEVQI